MHIEAGQINTKYDGACVTNNLEYIGSNRIVKIKKHILQISEGRLTIINRVFRVMFILFLVATSSLVVCIVIFKTKTINLFFSF